MGTTCPKCAYQRKPTDAPPDYSCPSCGVVYAKFDPAVEANSRVLRARSSGDWSGFESGDVPVSDRAQAARGIPITTTHEFPGRSIIRVVDVVSAECAFGMNIVKDVFASVTDIVGGRSVSTQTVLRDARKAALEQLRAEAFSLGAHAVVGVRLDFNEFSGGGKTMLFVVAIGTAVMLSS